MNSTKVLKNELDKWKEACPVNFTDRFIDVKQEVEYEIAHYNLKVSQEEIEQVIEAYMAQDWSQSNSFILFLISEVQAGNL